MSIHFLPMPRASRLAAAVAILVLPLFHARAADSASETDPDRSARTLDKIVVRGLQPTSLPLHIPTTNEGITGDQVRERTNASLVADARVRYRRDSHWSIALGVDNLGGQTYWNFHPYNQRTWTLELRFDQ